MITTNALNHMIAGVNSYEASPTAPSGQKGLVGLSSTNTTLTTVVNVISFTSPSNGMITFTADVVLQAVANGTISKIRLLGIEVSLVTMITTDISPTITVQTGQYVTVLASGTSISLGN